MAYDVMGGMRAVVLSDVVQVLLIVAAVAGSLVLLLLAGDGLAAPSAERVEALDFSWGLTDGDSYGFWPMLIGGMFLYMAYYGCDQSQTQRVLAARSAGAARRVLLLNGVLRFPLVLLYCLLGLALAGYAANHPGFLAQLPVTAGGDPNFNMVFPTYVLHHFPAGLVGLVIAGILAAAMSSIDSALNSLSAATVQDFVDRRADRSEGWLFVASKLATAGWGLFAVAFSFQVERIAPTVLEAINKIGSMANGPLLAMFLLAAFFPKVGARAAVAGFLFGLLCNGLLWWGLPQVSWLWWNVTGGVAAFVAALACKPVWQLSRTTGATGSDIKMLSSMALLIFGTCLVLQWLATS